MPQLQRLRTKIGTTKTLLGLVRNVKALAAVTIREQQMVSSALNRYEQTVLDSLALLARELPDMQQVSSRNAGRGRIVFGSDQGLCGTFNQRLAQSLEPESGSMIAVGHRIGRELERRGHNLEKTLVTPSSASGAHAVVGQLLEAIKRWQALGLAELLLVYNLADKRGLGYQPTQRTLLPLDDVWWQELRVRSWEGPTLPRCLLSPALSLGPMLRQWMYVAVYRCMAESRLAESGARLDTMQSAQNNISGKLEDLERKFRSQRQALIDAELLDISAGFESLVKE